MIDRGASHPGASEPARCVFISPCRDESAYMRRTLDSVMAQTRRPDRWIIVDDGSTDGSPAILAEYAAAYPWITVITRPDRGRRAVGPGVIDAFYAGLGEVDIDEYQYLCKLDLDLDLPPRYFELLIRRMETDARLGTCSGKPYFPHPRTGEPVSEMCGDEMSVGMTKFYRTGCFREIGGFVREVMWDGIDCHRCRMLGWDARSWDDPGLRFVHLRAMGSSQKGVWTGRARHGAGQWYMGTGPLYMLASAVFRVLHPPLILGSAGMCWGYARAMLTRRPRHPDAAFRAFVRRFQWESLVVGKQAAARRALRRGSQSRAPVSPQPPLERDDRAADAPVAARHGIP